LIEDSWRDGDRRGQDAHRRARAILAGWRGRPCHIITVNDYLAERDAKWFAKLYAFAG